PAISIALSLSVSSCSYYMVQSFAGPHNPQLDGQLVAAQSQQKYFILNAPDHSYSMNTVSIDSQNRIIRFILDSVSSNHRLYLQRVETKSKDMKYKRNTEQE